MLVKVQGQLILAGGRGKVKLELYNADRTTLIGPMVDDMVIDLAKTPKLNIKGSGKSRFQNRRFSSMSFFVDGKMVRTDSTVPSWMLGDPDSAWTPTVGVHTIKAAGYRFNEGKGDIMLESSVRVIMIDTRTKTPTKAPAAGPVAAPIAAPVVTAAAPAAAPIAPGAAPIVAPKASPVVASPIVSLVAAPTIVAIAKTKAPTKGPTTKAPTRRPTSSPTAAPTPCVNDIVKYINSITLSNQTLTVMSASTRLDFVLLQLLVSNARKGVRLSTCDEAGRKRLRQRYAYLALVYSTGVNDKVFMDTDNECNWNNQGCDNNGTVNSVTHYNYGMAGSIPADVGLWTGLTIIRLDDNSLTGALPTTVGLWTRITSVFMSNNKLNGTLPSSISAWTALTRIHFEQNQFSGQLPSSIGAWTDIQSVYIYNNKFTGPLPTSIGRWANLYGLYMANNGFSGQLPASIGAWANLGTFLAQNNQFTGLCQKVWPIGRPLLPHISLATCSMVQCQLLLRTLTLAQRIYGQTAVRLSVRVAFIAEPDRAATRNEEFSDPFGAKQDVERRDYHSISETNLFDCEYTTGSRRL
jgi:hypothetical protein